MNDTDETNYQVYVDPEGRGPCTVQVRDGAKWAFEYKEDAVALARKSRAGNPNSHYLVHEVYDREPRKVVFRTKEEEA